MHEELKSYVDNELSKGISLGEIRKALIEQGGWSDTDLNSLLNRSGGSFSRSERVGYLIAIPLLALLGVLLSAVVYLQVAFSGGGVGTKGEIIFFIMMFLFLIHLVTGGILCAKAWRRDRERFNMYLMFFFISSPVWSFTLLNTLPLYLENS